MNHIFIYSFTGWWAPELFQPLDNYELCCYEHSCACFCKEKVFLSLWCIPRSGIAGSCHRSVICSITGGTAGLFQSGCTVLHSHQQWRGSWFLHTFTKCVVICLLILAFSVGGKDCLIMAGFAFPWCSEGKHCFIYVLSICMSSLEKCIFKPFVHFLKWIIDLLFLSERTPCIFQMQIPY